jgi:alkylation response protein AidB-like acyl-CoA dehydrogenase
MVPFAAPLEDILFSLQHVAGFEDETAGDVITHFAQFAEGVLAPVNAVGDRQGARLENGVVRMPDGFHEAYAQLAQGGWQGLTAPEDHGGMGLSPLIAAGVSEIFSGANHSMQMVCNLVPGAIAVLLKDGTPAQQAAWLPKLVSGEALSTMALTEPGAGSDLAAIRTRATRDGDHWRLDGEKIFISGGDQDMSDSILHLVLARTSDDGLKGLSLFLCGKQPGARVTRIEEKLGLHASPTCQMLFDGAAAQLIGEAGAGLAAMFTLMNHARIDVALQGVAHAARATQIAAAYAAERKQGRKADKTNAMLSDHADVRRMLDRQASLAMGARAMCHFALAELEAGTRPALVEFLTPLCKVFSSEAGIEAADLGIQILGGYGYLEEYGLSQTWRDARITAIYEGANGIHARSLATRGLRPGGGADGFAALIEELSQGQLADALRGWHDMRQALSTSDDPLPQAHAFCQLSGQLYFQAAWCKIAASAAHHPQGDALARLAAGVLS